jgi:hypothetical protein
MANESMFEGVSIFDAAANENAGIRDRALGVAQLGRGRVGVYGSALAGGMVTRGLASMAGMKTNEEQKAETITNIMSETQNLDRSDPNSIKLIAQKFIAAGYPEIGQKFYMRARTIEQENKTYNLEERKVDIQKQRLTLEEKVAADQSKQAWKNIGLSELQINNNMYKFEKGLEFDQSKFNYQQKQDSILNELANERMTIEQARLALSQNANAFTQAQVGVENTQWQQAYDLENYIKKAQVSQGWKRLSLDADQYKHMVFMDKAGLDLNTAKFAFEKANTAVINAISQGSLDIEKGRLILQQSSLAFDKHRAGVTDNQWLEEFELNKLLANADVKYKEAQTESVKLSNEYYPKARELEEALTQSQIAANTTKVVDDRLWIKDADGNSWHEATTADGKLLSDYDTAKEFGISADTKRILDAVWKEYQALYYTGGSLTENAKWGVPEHLSYDAVTNPKGMHKYPTFQDFAKMSVENGGHGGQIKVVAALEAAYGGEGTYVQHLRDTAVIDRKPNQIIRTDDSGESFLTEFSIDDLSQTYNISTDMLGQTAVFPKGENLDKDSNAQIIAELEAIRGAFAPDSVEYQAGTTRINEFISGFTTPKDVMTPSDAAVVSAAGGQMVEDTQAQVIASIPEALVPKTQVQEKAFENRTNEAVRMTGISREDGEWKQVGRVMPAKQNSAEYKKGTDGNWYRWSAKSTETLGLGKIISGVSGAMDTALEGVISNVASIYK